MMQSAHMEFNSSDEFGEWRCVPGLEDSLYVSDKGYVWQKVRHGRWVPPRLCKADIYGYVKFKHSGKHYKVHRLVALAFLGPAPSRSFTVDHINGNKSDNRVQNLRWASKSTQCSNQRAPKRRRDASAIWMWRVADDRSTGRRFESSTEAAAATGVYSSNIGKVLNGTYSHTGGWRAERCSPTDLSLIHI